MAQYNGNGYYVDIDGTNISSYVIEMSLEPAVEAVDVTAGASTTHRERNAGLKDYTFSMSVGYDDSAASTILPLVAPGAHTVTFGPEGSANGKPKHVQSFIIEGAGHTVAVSKSHVVFSVSGSGAAAPTTDMYAGGVWS
jgi:hypothetical protein